MITNSRPHNATPQRLNLAPPLIPRMPFSSPMGEEVLSPTSPPQDRTMGPRAANGQSKNALNNGRDPTERFTNGGHAGRKQKGQDRSRLPGLNVITSFSIPLGFTQRAADGNGQQDQGLGLKRQGTQESMNKTGNLGLGHERSRRSLKPSASKGRLDDLKRAASKASTLSPSDRAVMIGISVSPEDLADHDISADASPAEPQYLGRGRYPISRRPSVTPSTVLTPAQSKAPWSDDLDELVQSSRRRARAASSVYSQAQKKGVRVINSSIVPPIPPLPPDVLRHKAELSPATGRQPPPSSSRIVSTSTIFDEEHDPDLGETPSTGESQLRILTKKASIDSIATRHRSRGWWDHIVTPFWPRSPMNFKGISPLIPTLPNACRAIETRHDRDRPTSHIVSPETAEHEVLRSGHTSWTDMSQDAACEKRALDLDEQPHKELLVLEPPRGLPATDTPMSPVRHEGFGAASEYYEGCLYDMHSPEPYFKCQNHTCLLSQVGPVVVSGQNNTSARTINEGVGPREALERQDTEPQQSLAVQQVPGNRFSAAFREAVAPESRPKPRPVSEETEIEDLDTTPDVEEAYAAPIIRALEPIPTVQSVLPDHEHEHTKEVEEFPVLPPSEPSPHQPPAYSPPRQERPPRRYVAVMPPDHQPNVFGQNVSPAPQTPGVQRQMHRDTPLIADLPRNNAESQLAGTRNMRIRYYENPETSRPKTTLADLYPPPRHVERSQKTWEIRGKDTQMPREHKSKVLAGFDNCFGREKKPMSKKKKWLLSALAIGLLFMVILIMVLAMTLTRKGGPGQVVPVQTAWLNMTGYPPIPTGISTIVQPKAVSEVSNCVVPSTMWSCDLPKEEQQSFSTGAANQPNFRVEIVFQNGTNDVTANTSSVDRRSYRGNQQKSYGHMVNSLSASSFIRDRLRQVRNALSENSYSPSPLPPNQEDQTFLGNTTDKNTVPFNGEYTPFFMSFLSPTNLPSRLLKRQSSSSTDNTTDPFPNITNSIPPPDTNPNGTAAAEVFLPYPSAQPLRLYNRGQATEHYGFYTYFSKSIFLKSTAPIDGISNNTSLVPEDEDGGAEEEAASVGCTWAQTRFLVQIWTNKGFVASTQASDTSSTISPSNSTNLMNSSANDFQAPGSFPYPVTITLDRHGGDIYSKMLYCYGIDDEEKSIPSQKKIQLEDRSFGGTLVNPALGPFGDVNVTLAEGGPGGIDGGSGGCGCQWKNFAW
ncbi:MAG: hypothetical protein ALECFALPRED_010484 [Alectoria fallacina]|uniref:Glycoprotease family protein n=1 Tax=Alectoria fallacina TaxID=1903189 RepID=A0A8H3F4V8_9LECA|nr:MAG: hypothetical protein ALECFALPRED_010484 [Alectoria fallacina]